MVITEDSTAVGNEKAQGEMGRCRVCFLGTDKGELLNSIADVSKMRGSWSSVLFISTGTGCT